MQSRSAIVRPVIMCAMALASLQCIGCGPSGADAITFANQRIAELEAQERDVVQNDDGKWHSEAMEIRNATPGFKEDGAMRSMVNYEYRILRSADFDTEDEARNAELSAVDREWQFTKELFDFKAGAWTLVE